MSYKLIILVAACLGWFRFFGTPLFGDPPASCQPEVSVYVSPVVTALAIDEEGRRLATGGDDHLIRIWDLHRGDLLALLAGHADWVNGVAFSTDGRQLFSVGSDGLLARWDIESGSYTALQQQKAPLRAVAYVPAYQRLLSVGFDCPLCQIELGPATGQRRLSCPSRDMREVVVSPNGLQFAAGGRDGHIRVWSTADGAVLHNLRAHDRRLRALAYSPDGNHLVSAGEDRAICIWDTHNGQEIGHITRAEGKLLSLAVLSAERLAVGTSQNVIELWDFSTGKIVGTLTGHTGSVSALAHHRDWLVSGGYDAQVRVWRVAGHGEAVAAKVLDAGARTVHR